MSRLGEREVFVDMFAGIGIFRFPLLYTQGRRNYRDRINPESFAYLKQNIRLNEVEDIFVPVCGDCSKATPEGTAARVLWDGNNTSLS